MKSADVALFLLLLPICCTTVDMEKNNFAKNLRLILDQIEEAKMASRRTDNIELMAVSKTHPVEAIIEAIECGQLLFGENRVQELQSKFPIENYAYKVHLIGHLQSNKVRKAVAIVDSIDSVDSLKLLNKIDAEAKRIEKVMPILFEVNTSLEKSKVGFIDEKSYFEALEVASSLENIEVKGLMTIGPLTDDEKVVRSAFASLYNLKIKSEKRFPNLKFETLSMGMSYDFKWAIMEGSNQIRIGSALFGDRDYS
jgi:pyridoxal phosphate enzyme (YggS family)